MSDALKEVADELAKARSKFAPMRGAHEGYAVILEEVDELWEQVRLHDHDRSRLRSEAKQVAAMAIRFMEDVCGD